MVTIEMRSCGGTCGRAPDVILKKSWVRILWQSITSGSSASVLFQVQQNRAVLTSRGTRGKLNNNQGGAVAEWPKALQLTENKNTPKGSLPSLGNL